MLTEAIEFHSEHSLCHNRVFVMFRFLHNQPLQVVKIKMKQKHFSSMQLIQDFLKQQIFGYGGHTSAKHMFIPSSQM
jgi:hypothetical protein